MTKYTQRQLRDLVRAGAAIDITNADNETRNQIQRDEGSYTQIGYAAVSMDAPVC
jgi:hypothetical protein